MRVQSRININYNVFVFIRPGIISTIFCFQDLYINHFTNESVLNAHMTIAAFFIGEFPLMSYTCTDIQYLEVMLMILHFKSKSIFKYFIYYLSYCYFYFLNWINNNERSKYLETSWFTIYRCSDHKATYLIPMWRIRVPYR